MNILRRKKNIKRNKYSVHFFDISKDDVPYTLDNNIFQIK